MRRIKVLLIEDNPGDAIFIREMLDEIKNVSFDLEWRDRLSTGLECLANKGIDVVLLDLTLPDSKGFNTFIRMQTQAPEVPIVVLTGFEDESFAINAVRKGAQDYLIKKNVNSELLTRTIRYAIERKQTEKALKDYAAELKEANRLKDLFTKIISLDLLDLTAFIRTVTELKLEETKDEEMRNSLLMIKWNADKIIEMLRNTSMYAMLTSAQEFERNLLDLNEVLKAVIQSFGTELKNKKITLEYLVKDECLLMANPTIENVFSILINNAIKYSQQGGKVEVNIVDKNTTHYKIYVKDWGLGIKNGDKARIFTRFQRMDKDGVKGTGLGLAIAKRIVDLHGGRIWIEDNVEGGSIFYVEIPRS
jgi:signal transduction histidine kinase